jgi:hypothetical protein
MRAYCTACLQRLGLVLTSRTSCECRALIQLLTPYNVLLLLLLYTRTQLLEKNVKKRLTAEAALKHPWLSSELAAAAQPHLSLEVQYAVINTHSIVTACCSYNMQVCVSVVMCSFSAQLLTHTCSASVSTHVCTGA